MPYSYPEIRQMRGLYQQRNSFTVPDGALEQALNLTVKNDNILTSRRGFHQYFNVTSGTLNNLFRYQDVLIAMYNAKMAYYTDTGSAPNQTGSETAITGETVLNSGSRISRELQSNSNLYMTTDNGMLKLTAYTSDIIRVGAPQGLDIGLRFLNGTSSNFLGADKIVGYRVVFGNKDANDNLILGAPSQISEITNVQVLTATGAISGGGPSYTITVTSTAHGRTTGEYLIFSDAESSGPTEEPNAEGTYQITVTGANTFTYSVASTPTGALTQLYYGSAMPVRLEMSIPSEIGTDLTWFYQIYRSSQQTSTVGIFSDFKLISETEVTSAEISDGLAYFLDDTDDILLGAELYTNENSREGETQANYRPPLCDDVALFKGHAIYAKCTTRHLIALGVIDTTQIATTDYIEVKVATTRRYVAQTGIGNQTVRATMADDGGGDIEIGYTAHGFADGDSIRVDNITGTLSAGTYFVINKAANTLEISLTKGGAAVAWTDETVCEIQGITEQAGDYPMFFLSESTSASVRLRTTAEAITKAMNRDSSAEVYASYTSGINDIPGQFALQAKGFGVAISLLASDSTVASGFSPVFPTSFSSGTQVTSKNEDLPHTFYAAKEQEPEAVPLVNRFPVGSKNAEIFRVKALRDSLILLKGDGVWRVTGDNPNNFVATLLDGTVICVAPNSVDIINNQVAFLSNQGVCFVTESSVQILSREGIEDPLQPILGQADLAAETAGLAYESDRLYLLTTTEPNTTTASVTYAYNILTQEWTTWDRFIHGGVVGPGDKLFYIDKDNNDIRRERKNQDRTDYADENHSLTIDSISDLTLTVTMTTGVPMNGDMLIKNNVITRVTSDPTLISGSQYSFTVGNLNNLEAADTPILYSKFDKIIKLAPVHAGLVGRAKYFSQFQIHMRDNAMSKCSITFSNQAFGGSEEINWVSPLSDAAGFGNFAWGFEPWGQETGLELTIGTQAAPIVRVLLGQFAARATYIQPTITHSLAGEPTNIQAFSFAVRPYNERVTT